MISIDDCDKSYPVGTIVMAGSWRADEEQLKICKIVAIKQDKRYTKTDRMWGGSTNIQSTKTNNYLLTEINAPEESLCIFIKKINMAEIGCGTRGFKAREMAEKEKIDTPILLSSRSINALSPLWEEYIKDNNISYNRKWFIFI